MLMIVNFFSPDGRYDDIYLSNYATINIKDELLRVRRASRTSTTWASATTASAPGSTRRSWRRAT